MNEKPIDVILKKITDTITPSFSAHGFSLRKKKFFEYKDENGNLFQYKIDLRKLKGSYYLHLLLNVFNDEFMEQLHKVLEAVLRSDSYTYSETWDAKFIESFIRGRLENKVIYCLTDWRIFKKDNESLEEFNSRFSIWIPTFDDISEIPRFEEQFIESVDMAMTFFFDIYNIDWMINNTVYPSLFWLKKQNKIDELMSRYETIYPRCRDRRELKLFMEYLTKE